MGADLVIEAATPSLGDLGPSDADLPNRDRRSFAR